jgi:hypothetical protein
LRRGSLLVRLAVGSPSTGSGSMAVSDSYPCLPKTPAAFSLAASPGNPGYAPVTDKISLILSKIIDQNNCSLIGKALQLDKLILINSVDYLCLLMK